MDLNFLTHMPLLDIILGLILLWFVGHGWRIGVIHAAAAMIGIILGTSVAGIFYEPFSKFTQVVFREENMALFVSFVVLFLVTYSLVSWVGKFLTRITKLVSWLPFVKLTTKLGGALLGFLGGVLILGLLLSVHMQYPASNWLQAQMDAGSSMADYIISTAALLKSFIPEIIQAAKSFIS